MNPQLYKTILDNAMRYEWLRENCIRTAPASSEGPAYKKLHFSGKLQSDWRSSIDHLGLDKAIDMEMANDNHSRR